MRCAALELLGGEIRPALR